MSSRKRSTIIALCSTETLGSNVSGLAMMKEGEPGCARLGVDDRLGECTQLPRIVRQSARFLP